MSSESISSNLMSRTLAWRNSVVSSKSQSHEGVNHMAIGDRQLLVAKLSFASIALLATAETVIAAAVFVLLIPLALTDLVGPPTTLYIRDLEIVGIWFKSSLFSISWSLDSCFFASPKSMYTDVEKDARKRIYETYNLIYKSLFQ